MKIKKLIIEDFSRRYYGRIEIDFEDLTAFIEKNDVRKSTTLEALDIFFNDGKGNKEDLNKIAEKEGNSKILIVGRVKRKASILRRCIREYYRESDGKLRFENIEIPITQGSGRDVWNHIQRYLPLYAPFKANRTNTDENPEIQDPLKIAV